MEMQEGRGRDDQPPDQPGRWFPLSNEEAEPGGDDTSPGASPAPSPGTPPAPSSQPAYGQPGRHAHAGPPAGWPGQAGGEETPPGVPTTELGTWSMSASGQGTWEPPPGGGYGQPGGGYGPPPGGYGQPGGPPPRRSNRPLIYVLVAVLAA